MSTDGDGMEFREAGIALWKQWDDVDTGESIPELLARAMRIAAEEALFVAWDAPGGCEIHSYTYASVASRIGARIDKK